MTSPFVRQSAHARQMAAKASYSKEASKKLIDSRLKLAAVNATIRNAIATGKIYPSRRLELAQRAMESSLVVAEDRLEKLRKSDENGWQAHRTGVENAWEDFSHSIKNVVTRYSDGSR